MWCVRIILNISVWKYEAHQLLGIYCIFLVIVTKFRARGEPGQHQNRKCFIIRCLFPSSCSTLSVIHQSRNENCWCYIHPVLFKKMLVFFLNLNVQHLFNPSDLINYCSPKHNGPTLQLAVVLSKAYIQALYTSWAQDSSEWFSSVVLHSAGSQSSPVWFA